MPSQGKGEDIPWLKGTLPFARFQGGWDFTGPECGKHSQKGGQTACPWGVGITPRGRGFRGNS